MFVPLTYLLLINIVLNVNGRELSEAQEGIWNVFTLHYNNSRS